MKRAILIWAGLGAFGCVDEPSYVGKACSMTRPCPGALVCVDDTCQSPENVRPDLGSVDLGPADLGADLGPEDQGQDTGPDLGPPDLGPPDLGPEDMGPPDFGPPDTGPPDLGPPDMGPPDLGPPMVLNVTINQSDQDALQDPGGPMLIAWNWISMYSDDHWGALRFDLSGLPPGAIIEDAYVQLYIDSLMEDSPRVLLWAEASDSPAPLTDVMNNISDRPRTLSMVSWIDENIGDGWQRTPPLNSLIEEVTTRPGWSGPVVIIFDSLDVVGMDFFEFRQWDNMTGAFSPQLVVLYRL